MALHGSIPRRLLPLLLLLLPLAVSAFADPEGAPPTLDWADIEAGRVEDGAVGCIWFALPYSVGAMNAPKQAYTIKHVQAVDLSIEGGISMEIGKVIPAWILTHSQDWNWPILVGGRMYCARVQYHRNKVWGLMVRGRADGIDDGAPVLGDVLLRLGDVEFETWSALDTLALRYQRFAAGVPAGQAIRGAVLRAEKIVAVEWSTPSTDSSLGLEVEEVPAHVFNMGGVGNVGIVRRVVTDSVSAIGANHIPLNLCRVDRLGSDVPTKAHVQRVREPREGIRVGVEFRNALDRPVLVLGGTFVARASGWEAEVAVHTVAHGHIPLCLYLPPGGSVVTTDAELPCPSVPDDDLTLTALEVNYAIPDGRFAEILSTYVGLKPKVSVKLSRKRRADPEVTVRSNEAVSLGVTLVLRSRSQGERGLSVVLAPGEVVTLTGSRSGVPEDSTRAEFTQAFIPAKTARPQSPVDPSGRVYIKAAGHEASAAIGLRRP